jgi:hypothetical protein
MAALFGTRSLATKVCRAQRRSTLREVVVKAGTEGPMERLRTVEGAIKQPGLKLSFACTGAGYIRQVGKTDPWLSDSSD